jgi:hypothetical protein
LRKAQAKSSRDPIPTNGSSNLSSAVYNPIQILKPSKFSSTHHDHSRCLKPLFSLLMEAICSDYFNPAIWRITIQTCPGLKQDPISKITNAKRGVVVVTDSHLVGHLPSKHKALSQLPSTKNFGECSSMVEHFV